MEKKYHIYGMGNALVDFEIETTEDKLSSLNIKKGIMTLIDDELQDKLYSKLGKKAHTRACGGSAANTIIGAQSLGSNCYYSCKVANDETGVFYKNDLLSCGVESNLSYQSLEQGKTGKCLVMVTPDADRTMNTFLGITGDINFEQINQSALKNSEYLYIEGYLAGSPIALAGAIKTMAYARIHNIKTAFSLSDPNIVNFCKDGLAKIIGAGVDILFCNEDEALAYSNQVLLEEAIVELKKIAQIVVVTLGSKGSQIISDSETIAVSGHAVKAIDTNGAGDLFAGAFLNAITRNYSLEQAGNIASYASAQLVTQFGPRLSSKNLLKVRSFINSLKTKSC